ncbi:DNA-binding response OmpR family regulator [Inhella inkyongensis]|uniref:DNA-binding response OmpR family regulator n=1 Tax=Inhella inkyongensis TaxID=392593 RepID=A0A840SA66_9BURK|nr:response regulator [Inhella inkyongensis]MBB5205674.1 DNA-binding response OmpR family regulator [Inhella inkyongensis]
MKTVLIVEDQSEIRELIRVTLEFEDYQIAEAANGEEGLREALRLKPDLVLLDVMMPGNLDGLQVCKRLRAEPGMSRTRIVMLTAKGQAADRQAGIQAGADAYLLKPFSPLELMKVCQKVMR